MFVSISVQRRNVEHVNIMFFNIYFQKSSLSATLDPAAYALHIPPRPQTDGALFVVHRQPIALDRFTIHDVRPPDNSGSCMRTGSS